MTYRILVSDNLHQKGVDLFAEREGFKVDVKTGLAPEALIEAIGEYDGLVVRSATKVTTDVLGAAEKLKVVGRAGTGVDNIAIPEATRRGIVVMNTPGGNSQAAAEHTITLIMTLHRHVPHAVASMKDGKWEKKKFQGREMAGKTLGVVGLGQIGSIVSRLASRGLKMRVLGYDPVTTEQAASKMGAKLATLDEIFGEADLVTVHTPLNKETRDLIDAAAIDSMKDGVMIVNCARGGVVNEEALLAALESGKVAAAALDVYSVKPPGNHPLVMHPRVIATPHLGASTAEAQVNVAVAIAEQMIDFLETGTVRNAVNVPAMSAAEASKVRPYVDLARRLGQFVAKFSPAGLVALELEYRGEIATLDTKPVTGAALVGLLSHFASIPVNEVNAAVIAGDKGISVSETTLEEGKDFASSIAIRAGFSAREPLTVQGALIHRVGDEPRITGIDHFLTEAVPAGPMLIVTNKDIPGMIAGMSGALAEKGINIAQMNLSRESAGGTALSIINIDSPADEATLDTIRAIDGILSVKQVVLDEKID